MLAPPRLRLPPGEVRPHFECVDLLIYRGVFGGLAVLLYFLAIAHIPVGLATLLIYTAPVWSATFAALFIDEPVDLLLLLPMVRGQGGVKRAKSAARAKCIASHSSQIGRSVDELIDDIHIQLAKLRVGPRVLTMIPTHRSDRS
jgi:hypothetical protein